MTTRILLLGHGVVGKGLCSLLADKRGRLAEVCGGDLSLVGVATGRRGCAYSPLGLDPLDPLARVSPDWTTERLVREAEYDVLAECTVTDPWSGEPAMSFIRGALTRGKSVTTSNKGPIALDFHGLRRLAATNGARLLFEGTVMAATPLFSALGPGLLGAEVLGFEGVLNGTCNFVIEGMKSGKSFAEALAEAQASGLAEADPTLDVEGWDATLKAIILAQAVMDFPAIRPQDVDRKGISHLTPDDLRDAAERGGAIRHVAVAERKDGKPVLTVGPRFVPASSPLCSIPASAKAVLFRTDCAGEMCITGVGSGGARTAFALLRDIVDIAASR